MDIHRRTRAVRIVGAYRETLTTIGHLLTFGVPATLLRHKRDDIRNAIRDLAQCLQCEVWPDAPVSLDELRTAYQSLASFVDDDDARIGAKLHRGMERGEYAVLASPVADAAARISKRIEVAARDLNEEFESFLRPKDDPLLSEVDAFLAEFQRKRTAPT